MTKLSSAFHLIGLMDGTTLNGFVRVDNTPLIQRYTKGSDKFVPDFKALPDNSKPTVYPLLREINSGALMVPTVINFFYNGVKLEFGPDGLCTSAGFEGKFKKIADYPAQITTPGGSGSTSHPMPVLRVMDNLVPLSGYDNDRISFTGQVEIGGRTIDFSEMSTPVVIQETTGNQYDVMITNDKSSALTEKGETLTEKVNLYKDGVKVNDLAGFTFQWVKELASGDVNMGTAQTQVISTTDVDNKLIVRCDVKQAGSIIASGYNEVTDYTEPYHVIFKKTGIQGEAVMFGQTAVVTPVAVKRDLGTEDLTIKPWTFRIKDNEGEPFTLTGQQSDTFTANSCSVTYVDIQRAKYGLSGLVQASF